MQFTVSHVTSYHYSAPIRLGPHRLRVAPRREAGRDICFSIEVLPVPVARLEEVDRWGNRIIALDFSGETDHFRIESKFTMLTEAPVMPTAARPLALPPLPWTGGAGRIEPDLAPFLEAPDPGPEVRRFAASLASGTDSPFAFLAALNETLFTRTDRHIRAEGYAKTAAETLATGRGACRDLTELFLAAARAQGIPARFASGYQARGESPDGRRHLHAWPEVWLPGLGWRGYDPTHGTPVTDGHVAVAVAPTQAETMTIEGSFWGGAVQSTLDYHIGIEARG